MEGRLIAFVIWVIIGVLFIVMGIYDFNSKKAKPFGFWANAELLDFLIEYGIREMYNYTVDTSDTQM